MSSPEKPKSSKPQSLWPSFRTNLEELRSPISIIKEQASQLAPQTQGLVTAKVLIDPESRNRPEDYPIHTFMLVCPPLGNYSVNLFEIATQLTSLYPVKIRSYFLRDGGDSFIRDVINEEELYKTLAEILRNEQTVGAIESMLAHAGAEIKKQPRKVPAEEDDAPF